MSNQSNIKQWIIEDLGYDGMFVSNGKGTIPKEFPMKVVEISAYEALEESLEYCMQNKAKAIDIISNLEAKLAIAIETLTLCSNQHADNPTYGLSMEARAACKTLERLLK